MIVQPRLVGITNVEAPLIVLVVGVMVTLPSPKSSTSNENPAVNPADVATGKVTAIALELLNVSNLPASVVSTV